MANKVQGLSIFIKKIRNFAMGHTTFEARSRSAQWTRM